jgi:hypothetical protein
VKNATAFLPVLVEDTAHTQMCSEEKHIGCFVHSFVCACGHVFWLGHIEIPLLYVTDVLIAEMCT